VIHGDFRGAKAITLENDQLRAVMLPDHGGKIASLYHRERRFELLFQNPKPSFAPAKAGDDFASHEACGFDDVFPAVIAEETEVGGRRVAYPDHGELWSAAMEARAEETGVSLRFNSALLPYRFEKQVSLEDEKLILDYRLTHRGGPAFPYVFLLHCLVAYREGMRVETPPGEKRIVGSGEGMGKWYLAEPVSVGRCGYAFPREGMRARFNYDPKKLPYLGYWHTEGGFRGDHNSALEPATAFYDGVSIAARNRRESALHPGETLDIHVSLALEPTENGGDAI
jgi:hypothetical protein